MKRIPLFLLLFFLPVLLIAQESETLDLLRGLIRIDTSNPPGNETAAAALIQERLRRDGIDSEILFSPSGRGNLIARLSGNGSKAAMILLGHLDVVPAEPSEWGFPPFGAEVADGMVWGRGALDMKGQVAMEVMTLLKIKRENLPLAGDLILVLTADEEAGGEEGAKFLVENHWDKIEARYLLNEGSVGVLKGGIHLYPIQVAEKGVAWMRITTRGLSGHGSMPTDDNAVAKLAHAVDQLASYRFPVRRTDVVALFLERVSKKLPFPENLGARYFFSPVIGPIVQELAQRLLAKERAISAVLSDTISPTILQAGYKVNVIPAEASASLDGRILPGQTPEQFRQTVQEILGDDFEVTLTTSSLPNESDFRTDFFRAIEEAVRREDPEAVTAPILSAGATDSRFFRDKGVIAYGLVPLLLTPDELEGLHGKNERVPVSQLERGSRIIFDIARTLQGAP